MFSVLLHNMYRQYGVGEEGDRSRNCCSNCMTVTAHPVADSVEVANKMAEHVLLYYWSTCSVTVLLHAV